MALLRSEREKENLRLHLQDDIESNLLKKLEEKERELHVRTSEVALLKVRDSNAFKVL